MSIFWQVLGALLIYEFLRPLLYLDQRGWWEVLKAIGNIILLIGLGAGVVFMVLIAAGSY